MLFGPLTCQFCGKQYMVNDRRRLTISKFCSRSCRGSGPNPKKGHYSFMHPKWVPIGTRRDWNGTWWVKTQDGWEREHRVVADLPRKARRSKSATRIAVHHINGDRTDNRPENLKIMTQAEHARLHNPERQRDVKGRLVAQQINSALVVEIA